jgi:signal transduction histidine kinase
MNVARWFDKMRLSRSAWFDLALAVTVTVLTSQVILGRAQGLIPSDTSQLAAFLIHVATGLALIWRRRAPFATGIAVAALTVLNPSLASLFGAYAVAAYVERRRAIAITVLLVLAYLPYPNPQPQNLLGATAVILMPGVFGIAVTYRRRLTQEREERAEREHELLVERVRLDERARIAGEMHDVVTHRVSLMVLQAGALRAKAPSEEVAAAAEDLRMVGRQALIELRDLVGVLRSEQQVGAAAAIAPAVLDVTDLIDASRTAGISVAILIEGQARELSPLVGRTAYRAVQEALTNVHKHAPDAEVRVSIRYEPAALAITITNGPAERPPDAVLVSGGTGLAGLRERVLMAGGTLRTGPTPDGGFELEARW